MPPHGSPVPPSRRIAAVTLLTTLTGLGGVLAAATPAGAAGCSDVQIIFARATGEAPGLGSAGGPFSRSLTSALKGKSVSTQAVDYAAAIDQSSAGPGASDMTDKVVRTAAACPKTRFVLGGYSQGASVTDIALGIRTTLGRGRSIPTDLAGRVDAVVVFGNPLGISRQTIETSSQLYGKKARSFCNAGDPVCGNGANIFAHLAYPRDGSTTAAATFAAGRVLNRTSTVGQIGDAVASSTPTDRPAASAQPQRSRWRSFVHSFGF
jgi:cutinase